MKTEQKMRGVKSQGMRAGKLADCSETPNCVCSQASLSSKCVEPLHFIGPAAIAWEKLQQLIAGMPRATIRARDERYLDAEFTRRIFRFVDDVECLLDEGVIHLRSASRVGLSDFGVNRARIEEIRRRWTLNHQTRVSE